MKSKEEILNYAITGSYGNDDWGYWEMGQTEALSAMQAYADQSVEAALKKEISFDTEYELEQFRAIEKDHFDDNGKAYTLYISTHLCERMLKLINQLQTELKNK